MSRHSVSRVDRVAQMSAQEEIIARKKLEILEKQRTAELARQVVAAQVAASKPPSKKEKAAEKASSSKNASGSSKASTSAASAAVVDPPSPFGSSAKNSFNNDGSFFENFKKITEAAKKAQLEKEAKLNAPAQPIITTLSQAQQELGIVGADMGQTLNSSIADTFIADFHPAAAALVAHPPPPPPPPPSAVATEAVAATPNPGQAFYDPSAELGAYDDDYAHHSDDGAPPPPVVTKALTQYTGLVPAHSSEDCLIPGFGPDASDEQAAVKQEDDEMIEENEAESDANNTAEPLEAVKDEAGAEEAEQNTAVIEAEQPFTNPPDIVAVQQQQPLPFMQSMDESAPLAAPAPSAYVNPFAQQVRPMPPQHFHPHHPMDPMHPHHHQHMQHLQHMQQHFAPHLNPFAGRPPPPQMMHHMHQHPFGGPPPFMPPAAAMAFHQQQQQQHQHQQQQQFQQHMQMQQHFHHQQQQQQQMQQHMQQQMQQQHAQMQLNAIAPPRTMDLAVIPEPTLNVDAIQVPDAQQQQQQQQLQQDISRDHDFIPTTVESLVELVAENGDEYEDRLRSRKIDMHSSLWFLCDTGSDAYRSYRAKVMALRHGGNVLDDASAASSAALPAPATAAAASTATTEDKYDPADMYNDDDDDDVDHSGATTTVASSHHDIDERTLPTAAAVVADRDDRAGHTPVFAYDRPPPPLAAAQQQPQAGANVDNDGDYDSDTEYVREARERNFGQQLKRKHDIDERQQQQQQQQPHVLFVAAGAGASEPANQAPMRARHHNDSSDSDGAGGGGGSSGSGGNNASSSAGDSSAAGQKKRSRWGDKVSGGGAAPQAGASCPGNPFATGGGGGGGGAGPSTAAPVGAAGMQLTQCTRTNPALLAYARQSYGTIELDDETWRKCEDHFKVNLLYQDMLRKRNEMDRLARAGKQKYEYDSDEDVAGGTWEHKARNAEMEATAVWSDALTKQAEGKHHIGDFLPPEELKKFMEKYESQQTNREPDLSDYREYKLREDNKGFQMLKKFGWQEGQGLGFDGTGIVDPVNKAQQRDNNQGLGTMASATPDMGDSEYDMYRKRMMLAYRFRPNPLNNPRRSYY